MSPRYLWLAPPFLRLISKHAQSIVAKQQKYYNMISDILFIVMASFASALFAEGISWLLIYRTDSYKQLKNQMDKLQQKVDKSKELPAATQAQKSKVKKVDRMEEALKDLNRDLSLTKMKSMFAVGISMIGLFGFLNSMFDAKVVAKLPFEPISIIQNLSHRGLAGEDYTDCAMVFIYVLSSMCIRPNLQKVLGTAPPKGANPMGFAMPK